MEKLSSSIGKLTKNISQKKDIRIFKIYQNWENIMGEELARQVTPYKITGSNNKVRLTVILDENIDYFRCQSIKIELIDRINNFFGDGFINRVIVVSDNR